MRQPRGWSMISFTIVADNSPVDHYRRHPVSCNGAAALDDVPSLGGSASPAMTLTTLTRSSGFAWSLPNILTYGRVAAAPIVAGCLFWPEFAWARWVALGIFIAAGVTDFLDGYLARAWAQQSRLGQMLDPIADKLLVSAVLMMLVADHTIASYSLAAAIIILCREILVSGLREFLAELKVPVPVSKIAKWKTALQLVALGFLIAGPSGDEIVPGVTQTGLLLFWLAALLTLYTGWDYLKASLRQVISEPS
jgi:cardiolipin synthase (CMP-forming)